MPLEIPNLFDRNYDQIVRETLARIPVHTREWTNFNDSDPGVTLVQLFAFMTENLLYRANQIPDRNRLKFLKLLGIPMRPATAAVGLATFANDNGPIQTQTLARGMTLFAGRVPFRTRDGLDVLPVEGRVFYKARILDEKRRQELEAIYRELYISYEQDGASLAYYETLPLEAPAAGTRFPSVNLLKETIDGYLWLALVARKKNLVVATRQAIAGKMLTLGILPAMDEAQGVLLPGSRKEGSLGLVYQAPRLSKPAVNGVAEYITLDATPSGDLAAEPGVVELKLPDLAELVYWENLNPLEAGVGNLPPSLEDSELNERLITWIRIGTTDSANSASCGNVGARFSWSGINAVRVEQKGQILGEILGQGSGEPDQSFTLTNKPIIPQSLVLTVNGEIWAEIDDFSRAGSEVPAADLPAGQALPTKVYLLDREAGTVTFGNGVFGMRPPAGSVLQAGYEFGGGRQGMVGIGAINKAATLPAGLKITNPLPTWGGADGETPAEAERRIPAALHHRDRTVSGADFREIASRTPGVDMGRVEVLAATHPDMPGTVAGGVVTLMVIPASDPVAPEAPMPDRLFIQTVCQYLCPRRLITTEIHVRGPVYLPVWVSLGISVVAGEAFGPVREAVARAVRRYLSPLTGGIEESGWPLEKPLERLELLAVAARVAGVAKINQILLAGPAGTAVERVEPHHLDLPKLVGLAVGDGDAMTLEALRGLAAPEGGPTVPVPVIPPEC